MERRRTDSLRCVGAHLDEHKGLIVGAAGMMVAGVLTANLSPLLAVSFADELGFGIERAGVLVPPGKVELRFPFCDDSAVAPIGPTNRGFSRRVCGAAACLALTGFTTTFTVVLALQIRWAWGRTLLRECQLCSRVFPAARAGIQHRHHHLDGGGFRAAGSGPDAPRHLAAGRCLSRHRGPRSCCAWCSSPGCRTCGDCLRPRKLLTTLYRELNGRPMSVTRLAHCRSLFRRGNRLHFRRQRDHLDLRPIHGRAGLSPQSTGTLLGRPN